MDTPDYRKFSPILAKRTAVLVGIAIVVVFGALFIFVPRVTNFVLIDMLGFILVGGFGVWFMYRQGSVRATVDEHGIVVRNLIYTRRLQWADIIAVHFGDGNPWARLDLANTETLAVMAIQRADGDYARQEAQRLANLVAHHSQVDNDN